MADDAELSGNGTARRWRVATDTGGTFTDCWALDPQGREHRVKVLSSGRLRTSVLQRVSEDRIGFLLHDGWQMPDDFFRGFTAEVFAAEAGADDNAGRTAEPITGCIAGWDAGRRILWMKDRIPDEICQGSVVELFTHEAAAVLGARLLTLTRLGDEFPALEFRVSTTRMTNALLEGKADQPVFFVTQGFGDLLEIGDQRRPELFALGHRKQRLAIAGIVEVAGRLDAQGRVLVALDESGLRRAAGEAVRSGATTAAVALAHSYKNPSHEVRAGEILQEEGFAAVSLSSQLSPLIRLLPRAQTAVVDAALTRLTRDFVSHIRAPLAGAGEKVTFLTSAGGLAAAGCFRAKDSLLSGPAGGVQGCAAVAKAAGIRKILTFDMGGTSTDVARWEGDFLYQFEHRVGPASILAPAMKIETVAAGGGSICHVSAEGLAVGPHSAGASPGPACYGRGGPLTLTDVNLLLGRLDPDKAAVPLFPEAARRRLVELRRDLEENGWAAPEHDEALLGGLLDIAIERMAEAVRRISVREGCDPADYTLVAFGGAGPQHACAIADRLGIRSIIVPRHAGLLSAFGSAQAPEESFAERQILRPVNSALLADLPDILRGMEREAAAPIPGARIRRRIAEIRLLGQETALALDFADPAELSAAFVRAYEALYGYAPPEGRDAELAALRVIASAPQAPVEAEYFPSEPSLFGPSMIQDAFSTMIIDPGWSAAQGSGGTWRLRRDQAPAAAETTRAEAVEAELFRCRFSGIVEAMGALLQRTAISTNVKERLDYSCALLDAQGQLVMNAPHIPVHLGALGECVRRVAEVLPMRDGDMAVTNDPAFAGSHLPDVTVICPVFDAQGTLLAYCANRAHHAEIGGIVPGSMPPFAQTLAQEGVVIPPMLLARGGRYSEAEIATILTSSPHPTRLLPDNLADLRAQAAAAKLGRDMLLHWAQTAGAQAVRRHLAQILDVSDKALRRKLSESRLVQAGAEEFLDDGWRIAVSLTADPAAGLTVDFTGSAPEHPYSRNATPAVVRSAVLYALRLWLAADIPLNEGILRHVRIIAPRGFLNPDFSGGPSASPAVVAGNVETSQRIVDALLRALEVEACSQGTMNNVIFGAAGFGHYETICGGAGAGPGHDGASALHTHMTNTAITDMEVLERRYPVRIESFSIRRGSGGAGKWRGGDGVVREFRFLQPMTVSFLTEHRKQRPFGMNGGEAGQAGRQALLHGGKWRELPGSDSLAVEAGDVLRVETPGGGGWGK